VKLSAFIEYSQMVLSLVLYKEFSLQLVLFTVYICYYKEMIPVHKQYCQHFHFHELTLSLHQGSLNGEW